MFCPKCKAEFSDGQTLCADCGVELVSELPGEPETLSVTEKREFMKGMSRHIGVVLKIGGIIVVLMAVVRAILASVPLSAGQVFSFDVFLPVLASLPSQLVLGLAYFGLGELIILLRDLNRGGEENDAN